MFLISVLALCVASDASGAAASAVAKPAIKIIKDSAQAWDPDVQKRVAADMADGKPSRALQPPRRVAYRLPKYPEAARKAGIQGVASVEARIGVNGRVEEFTVAHGEPQLLDAVKAAVSSWRYTPLKIDGAPYSLRINVEVSFALQ